MANTCKTCRNEAVDEINNELAAEVPLWKIVAKFNGLSLGGLQRHKERCIRALFDEVREQKRAGLLKDVDELKAEILEVKQDFGDNGNVRVQLIARRKEAIELEAKLTGAFVNPQTNPKDAAAIAKAVADRLIEKGADPEEARMFAAQEYGIEHQLIG